MDLEKVMDGGSERGRREHEVQRPRDSAVVPSFRPLEGTRPPSVLDHVSNAGPSRSSNDAWGAIHRLQTQVSLNTSLLESNRRQIANVEQAVGSLQQDIGGVLGAINDMRAQLQARPAHDAGDLDVLAAQMATVTSKANAIDSLKVQIELLKNRIKREHGSPPAPRPGSSLMPTGHRELYETTPQQNQLPPMRMVSVMSPPAERVGAMAAPPVLLSQPIPGHHTSSESHSQASEHSSIFPSAAPSFRHAEPLPPPSALSGWRPNTETHSFQSTQTSSAHVPFRPQAMEPDSQNSGWAAVNANHAVKRPFEEQRPSPYGASSAPGSPKRPKLAPIMPRSSHGDESYVPTPSSMQQTATTTTPDGSFRPCSRATSDAAHSQSQSQSHSLLTPSSANTASYRFITSTAEIDSQASWRPDAERIPQAQHAPAPAAGKGRGRGGRGRSGRARGGRGGAQPHPHESQELSTPEWERADWTGSQVSPDGYHHPMHPAHGGVAHRPDGMPGHPPDHSMERDYPPATPSQAQTDPFGPHSDMTTGSSGKKSRTKPIRNAEGILIRKDGRPDMRSVSSANNLRKVHAKKDAERAEHEGRTPTSARSLAPAHSNSLSDDDHERTRSGTPGSNAAAGEADGEPDEQDTQERHQALMSKIFPHGIDGAGGRGLAGAYFPRHEEPTSGPDAVMKTKDHEDEEARREHRNPDTDSQMTDAVMREMSEAQPQEHHLGERHPQGQDDGKMDVIQEQVEAEHTEQKAEAHAAEQSAAIPT